MMTPFEEARAESYDEGFVEGEEAGMKQEKLNIVQCMLSKNMDINLISEITGLTVEEITSIQHTI
jgi:predicted transposase/invertase (TIGR01784 family)